jgi:hypothetical protein
MTIKQQKHLMGFMITGISAGISMPLKKNIGLYLLERK